MTPLRKDKSTRANAQGIHVQNCFQRANKLAAFPAFLIPKTSQSHLSELTLRIHFLARSETSFLTLEKTPPIQGDINLWRTLEPAFTPCAYLRWEDVEEINGWIDSPVDWLVGYTYNQACEIHQLQFICTNNSSVVSDCIFSLHTKL